MSDSDPTQKAVLDLATQLMAQPSVTPEDADCLQILGARLQQLGFQLERLDAAEVSNLWATRQFGASAADAPHLVFAGHTDVVPSGPEAQWDSPPFTPTLRDGVLFGRGAADMKSSLAAMVVACEQMLARTSPTAGTLSFLLTSDEEGPAQHGTRHVVDTLAERGIRPDFCIVGEPSSSVQIGDVVRCGRRGSINGELVIKGVQGHVAYPDDADNPIHAAMAALHSLTQHAWDEGNEYYPPTSLQISNINGGTGATNVIPGELRVWFNLRFSTEQTIPGIQAKVTEILAPYQLDYNLDWHISGAPFLTRQGRLTDAVRESIARVTGLTCELSTSGGTSDGRFIAPWAGGDHQVEVVEVGPTNATIHKINECISLTELAPLAHIYAGIAERLLIPEAFE
ncbi:MAG: succinyl-diaminopimelate desuccinylase [Pseudomonadota bacterium]